MAAHPSSRKVEENLGAANRALADWPFERILHPKLEDLCAIHRCIFGGICEDEGGISAPPGELKKSRTFIPLEGNRYMHHCAPEAVASSYAEFLTEMRVLRAELACLERASRDDNEKRAKLRYVAAFHCRLIYIHPFADGNGRLARAIAVFQLYHLFGDDVSKFEIPAYWNRDGLNAPTGDPLMVPVDTHTPEEYLRAMGKADENLQYLARYFNLFFPELEIRDPIPPPRGRVKDIRSEPPALEVRD